MRLEKLRLLVVGISIFVCIGCVGNQATASNAPKWIDNPDWINKDTPNKYYVSVQSAEENSLHRLSAQKNEAKLLARTELKKQIEADLVNKDDLKSTTGSKDSAYAFNEDMASHVEGKLRGSKVLRTWINPKNNRLHLLMVIEK
jgi:hypothetical protein